MVSFPLAMDVQWVGNLLELFSLFRHLSANTNYNSWHKIAMSPFFGDYLDRLRELHIELKKALEGLPQEALDFKPAEDIPSICILVVHLTGAERYWIGDVVAKRPSDRDRGSEFKAHSLPASVLEKRLDDALEFAQDTIRSMTVEDLGALRISARDGRQFTIAWALLHALEHTAVHLGHVQIIRQLWLQNHP